MEFDKRKRIGKRLSLLGLLILSVSIFLGIALSVTAGSGASSDLTGDVGFFLTLTSIIGGFLLAIGIIAYVIPEKESHTYIWSMKTGPFK